MAGGMGMIGAGAGAVAGGLASDNKIVKEENSEKRMADYYYDLSQRKFEEQGVVGQTEQLRKAGLSVGLMYGSGGGGGSANTSVTPSSRNAESTTGAMGMGMQAGLQMEMMKAQKDNLNADTEKKKAEAVATSTENDYRNKGVFEDGITGNQVRYQQEMAQMFKTESERTKVEQEIEQMPKELQNKTKEVIIKAGELQNNIRNATTNEDRVRLENEIARQRVEIEKFRAEIEAEFQGKDKVIGRAIQKIIDDGNEMLNINSDRNKRKVNK